MFLREKDKQTLNAIFSQLKMPVEVWAYGSCVNGTAHEGSDLDLVIQTADVTPLPYDVYALLREQITDSNIPI